MRFLVVLGLCLMTGVLAIFAQTDTPIVPTATPETYQMWTLGPSVSLDGTPVPARDVVFGWQTDAGDVSITFLLAGVLFELWAMFGIYLLITRKEKR